MNISIEQIRAFIESKHLLVLCNNTSEEFPNGSLLFYYPEVDTDKNTLDFYIMTSKDSGKYKDLTQNPKVAYVIGTEMEPVTYQGRAMATEIENEGERAMRLEKLLSIAEKNSTFWPPIMMISKNMPSIFKLSALNVKGYDARGMVDKGKLEDTHQFYHTFDS